MRYLDNIDLGGVSKIVNLPVPSGENDLVNVSYLNGKISDAVNDLIVQNPINAIQVDSTLDPTATPTSGDRYFITDSTKLNANFGTIEGIANNTIVEFDGTKFNVVFNVASVGVGLLVYNKDDNNYYQYGSTGLEKNEKEGSTANTKFSQDIGDASATSIEVPHNLNTLDVIVQVYDKADGSTVECTVARTDVNNVTLTFASAPAENSLRVVVIA